MPTLLNGQHLGLSDREKKQYSLSKAILGAADGSPHAIGGIEGEAHAALYERLTPAQKARSRGVLVPAGDLSWGFGDRQASNRSSSFLNTGTFSEGGALVATDHLGDQFIESLRNRSRVLSMPGVVMLPGRQGNLAIPKMGRDTEVFWVSENQKIPETDADFSQLTLTPKTAGAIATFSRNLLLQSDPNVEGIIKTNLVETMAIGVDKALIYGTTSQNQPLGIMNTPGIQSVEAGTPDGGPLTHSLLARMEAKLFGENAQGDRPCWLVNSEIRKAARLTTQNASNVTQWIWQEVNSPEMAGDGAMLGHAAKLSNNLASDSTKGGGTGLSHLILGDFSSLIFASWSTIELLPNQFGRTYETGGIELRILYSLDSAIRHPESFCVCTDVDTAIA